MKAARLLLRQSRKKYKNADLTEVNGRGVYKYMGCPEIIRPFWISWKPVAWPWCNFVASQRRLYSASLNSHSPVGLVSRQWDAIHWACVLCDRRNDRTSWSANLHQCACPFYSSRAGFSFFCKTSHHPGLSAPLQPGFGSLRLLVFSKAKIAIDSEEICECDSHTEHKLSQQRLTADLLAPRESDSSRMRSKVSPDWLTSYMKVTRPVLEIFKLAGYFPDRPRTHVLLCLHFSLRITQRRRSKYYKLMPKLK